MQVLNAGVVAGVVFVWGRGSIDRVVEVYDWTLVDALPFHWESQKDL